MASDDKPTQLLASSAATYRRHTDRMYVISRREVTSVSGSALEGENQGHLV